MLVDLDGARTSVNLVSFDFTGSAERDNDENLVIVDDPALARAYPEEFQRVYAQAQAPLRCC